jgi:phosphoribosyl-ATP pyrophosphohydrolase
LDALGADAQVGMAIYTGQLGLAEAFCAPLQSDREDGLWPTVVCDESERALGLVYSNLRSVEAALNSGKGVYWSRKRGLWEKGASSGASQKLLRLEVDCDRDCLRAVVRQSGPGFCHHGTASCWGEARGLAGLEATLRRRQRNAPEGSYTARLFADPSLLGSKLREEAEELATAVHQDELVHEASDVIFFTLTRLRAAGLGIAELEAELDRRARVQTRRGGDKKS